jgi:hypothetical protein
MMTLSNASLDLRERNLHLAIEMSSVALTICWDSVVQQNPGRPRDVLLKLFRERLGDRELSDD